MLIGLPPIEMGHLLYATLQSAQVLASQPLKGQRSWPYVLWSVSMEVQPSLTGPAGSLLSVWLSQGFSLLDKKSWKRWLYVNSLLRSIQSPGGIHDRQTTTVQSSEWIAIWHSH